MFSNPGKALKIIAGLFLIVGLIASIFTAIPIGAFFGINGEKEGIIGFIVGWVISLIVFCTLPLLLYAIGEITDNTKILVSLTRKAAKNTVPVPKASKYEAPPKTINTLDIKLICPNCGTQRTGKYCMKCGYKF